MTPDSMTRSPAGRVVDQQLYLDGAWVDAGAGQDNYVYDAAGRLTTARLPNATYTYGFGPATGCSAVGAGANTNRTSLSVTGAGTTTSCYNLADQLVSTSSIAAADIEYDARGNTLRLGSEHLDFDASDRHVRTEGPTHVTTYRRDPVDRIAERLDRTRISHVASTSATAASTSVSVTKPAGTQAGDLIVAAVSARGSTTPGNITASGWTTATNVSNGLGRSWVVWRYAAAGDPASWSLSVSGASHVTAAASTYRSTASSAPIAVSATSSSASGTTHTLPSVTTTDDAQHLVHVLGLVGTANVSAGGLTQRAAVSANASLFVADRFRSRPGAAGTMAATSDTARTSTAITVALVPVATVARYGHGGHTDKPQFVRDAAGSIVEWTVPLPGNTSYVLSSQWLSYSHANLHGDALAVTHIGGVRVWAGYSGPHGEAGATGPPPNTNTAGTSLGWHGGQQRTTDRSIVHMGARPYSVAHGRFLAVDPIEGGCANDYVYVFGDPVNSSDLDGMGVRNRFTCHWKSVGGIVLGGASIAAAALGGPVTLGIALAAAGFGLSTWGAVEAIKRRDEFGVFLGTVGLAYSIAGLGLAVAPLIGISRSGITEGAIWASGLGIATTLHAIPGQRC